MADRSRLLLIAGYLGALGLGAYELQRDPVLLPPPPAKSTHSLPALDVPSSVFKNIAAYDAITERPLFTPDRRPTAKVADEKPAPSDRANAPARRTDSLRLTAVVNDGGKMTALLEDRAGKTQALHTGEKFGDWRLQEIQDDSVVVVSGSRRETLIVHKFEPAKAKKSVRRRAPRAKAPDIRKRPTRAAPIQSDAAGRRPAGIPDKP